MTKATLAELLALVYRYYPRGMMPFDREHVPPGAPVYDDTEEYRRLVEAANRGRVEFTPWKAMVYRLGDRYGFQDDSLSLLSGGTDPAYSARIWVNDDRVLTFHVSLLGPYYGIHLPGVPGEEPIALDVAREIEATYPGYQQIPPEIGNARVQGIWAQGADFDEATIYLCLFSEVWKWADRLW